jgi:hypothetical protein
MKVISEVRNTLNKTKYTQPQKHQEPLSVAPILGEVSVKRLLNQPLSDGEGLPCEDWEKALQTKGIIHARSPGRNRLDGF